MRLLFSSSLLLALVLSAPMALALSDQSKETLQSLDYYKGQIDLKKRPFADGDQDSDIRQALSNVESKLKTVKERLAKIPETDRKDPVYQGYATWAGEVESTLGRWKAEHAALKDKAKARTAAEEAFLADYRDLEGALDFVKAARGTYTYDLDAKKMLGKWRAAEKLTAFAAKCDKDFTLVQGSRKVEACKNAAEWKATLTALFEKRIGENAKKLAGEVEGSVKRIANGEATFEAQLARLKDPQAHVKEASAPYAELFDAMGKPMPEDLFAPVVLAAKGYEEALKASQGKVAYKAGKFSDAGVSKAVTEAFAAKNVKVVAVSQPFDAWDTRKDGSLITHRVRDSVVLGRVDGEGFCRLFEAAQARQDHQGKGKFGETKVELRAEPAFRIARCK